MCQCQASARDASFRRSIWSSGARARRRDWRRVERAGGWRGCWWRRWWRRWRPAGAWPGPGARCGRLASCWLLLAELLVSRSIGLLGRGAASGRPIERAGERLGRRPERVQALLLAAACFLLLARARSCVSGARRRPSVSEPLVAGARRRHSGQASRALSRNGTARASCRNGRAPLGYSGPIRAPRPPKVVQPIARARARRSLGPSLRNGRAQSVRLWRAPLLPGAMVARGRPPGCRRQRRWRAPKSAHWARAPVARAVARDQLRARQLQLA